MNCNNSNKCSPKRPLQFKRGTSKAFESVNPILLYGEPAYEYDTKRIKVGDGVTYYNNLPYIGDHSKAEDGKSAYQIWKDNGNEGTINDFLESLVGEPGKSTYEILLSLGNPRIIWVITSMPIFLSFVAVSTYTEFSYPLRI